MSVEEVHELSGIDPWFLDNLLEIVETENSMRAMAQQADAARGEFDLATIPDETLRTAKRQGFSDRQLANIFGATDLEVRAERLKRGIRHDLQIG